MDFKHYTDREAALAADLVNHAEDITALREVLRHHHISGVKELSSDVLAEIHVLRPRLRRIFETENPDDAAAEINAMLRETGALPQITNHDDEGWHLHYTPVEAPLALRLTAEAAMGLAIVMREGGLDRLKTCASESCDDVFLDTSRNRSRRYCDPSICGNRANVAAYRARQRAAAGHASEEA